MTGSGAAAGSAIRGAKDKLLALFYPDICQICRDEPATLHEGYVCGICRDGPDGIAPIEPPFCECCGSPFDGEITTRFECWNCADRHFHFRHARSAARFKGVVQQAIHRFKYNNAEYFEPFLGELLVAAAKPVLELEHWDWIVPIPLHWWKLRRRGFNQALRLARVLGLATNIPVNHALLRRKRATRTQTRLSRSERTENVKGAFAWRGCEPLHGARIVLVDDVLTTGATSSACAKVLMENGAAAVDVWTVARNIAK